MKLNPDQIKLAAKIHKIIRLASQPGMDRVAIKLNAGPTYMEVEHARKWARAFELAEEGGNAFELAERLQSER